MALTLAQRLALSAMANASRVQDPQPTRKAAGQIFGWDKLTGQVLVRQSGTAISPSLTVGKKAGNNYTIVVP